MLLAGFIWKTLWNVKRNMGCRTRITWGERFWGFGACGGFGFRDQGAPGWEMVVQTALLFSSSCRHLEDNQISVIERGAFQDLKQLERL